MKLAYTGAHDEVEVPLSDGSVQLARRGGDPIEVADEDAAGLLEQEENWAPSDAAAKRLAAKLRKDDPAAIAEPDASPDAPPAEES